MLTKVFICCFVIATFTIYHTTTLAKTTDDEASSNKKPIESLSTTSASNSNKPEAELTAATTTIEASKDKRQISTRETQIYANHRQDSPIQQQHQINDENDDDPENAQETIYGPGPKPNQFIIRAVSPHQHQQHEDHQEPPQLRNYPSSAGAPIETTAAAALAAAAATTTLQRSHGSSQLLDQSQEIQHYAYLQELSRNQPKINAATSQAKSRAALAKKASSSARAQLQYSKPEEAEQRYAVTIQAPRQYHISPQYQQQHAHAQHQQEAQQYQIIPEEHFLKLIEQELQARAFHDEQLRQQHQAAIAASNKHLPVSDRSGSGKSLGDYRQRLAHPTPSASPSPSLASTAAVEQHLASLAPTPAYVQYVPRHRGGPKYLPLQQQQQQQKLRSDEASSIPDASPEPQPELPPQIAYYQPQISYKTLPNHPLARSSLEKEIEKLLANNQHQSSAAVQIVDSSNEPSAIVNHHHHYQHREQSQREQQHHGPPPQSQRSPKAYIVNTTPNSLLDANNQPFVPSLFRFSNYQSPTPIYPTQQIIDAKKLGPVVYPTQNAPTVQPAQPSQYYYQEEAAPSPSPSPPQSPPKSKAYRPKQYELKMSPQKSTREKGIKISTHTKYAQPLIYDFNNPTAPHSPSVLRAQVAPTQFYPSPPDPSNAEALQRPQHQQQEQQQQHHAHAHPTHTTPHTHTEHHPPQDFRQFVLPQPAPSQSSIFVSQGTGVTTPSRPHHHKAKTIEDVKQLRLPQPGDKPLTQAEFKALVDAGYPITAVPVPVPVPYETYIKDHPEYRNQPLDYAQIMRNAQQHYAAARSAPRLAVASEPSVKIVSSPTESQSASALGGGSVTYLRPAHGLHTSASSSSSASGHQQQRRHPRNNDKETKTIAENKKTEAERVPAEEKEK